MSLIDEETTQGDYGLADIRQHFAAGGKLIKNEGSRFAYQEHENELWLFVDGRRYTCSQTLADLVKGLCAERILSSNLCVPSEQYDSLLLYLLNHGSPSLSA